MGCVELLIALHYLENVTLELFLLLSFKFKLVQNAIFSRVIGGFAVSVQFVLHPYISIVEFQLRCRFYPK